MYLFSYPATGAITCALLTRSCERPLPAQCPRSIRRRWNPAIGEIDARVEVSETFRGGAALSTRRTVYWFGEA